MGSLVKNRIKKGLQIDFGASVLQGSVIPGSAGGEPDIAVRGSLYMHTGNGTAYVKTTNGTGTDKWTLLDVSDDDITNYINLYIGKPDNTASLPNYSSENYVSDNDSLLTAVGKLDDGLGDHASNTSNPHSVTKTQVGLGNVDNTSDINKPVSTAQQDAIDVVGDDLIDHTSNTSNPHSVTKTQVGLGNVDNTSDINKPVSTAQQTAINAKVQNSLSASTVIAPSATAVNTGLATKQATLTFDTVPTLSSTNPVTSNGIAQAIIDGVAGLWDLRGAYNPTVTSLWPTTGGSGTAGAVVKADAWYISVPGTINGVVVSAGDMILALVDNPGQTNTNWGVTEYNLGYTPLNRANNLSDVSNVATSRSNLGLGNVDNTSDINKPVSTAQQAAIDAIDWWTNPNILFVDQSNPNAYQSIKAAVDTTDDYAPDNTYLILVAPGVYLETEIIELRPYTKIQGFGRGITIIDASSMNFDIAFSGEENNIVEGVFTAYWDIGPVEICDLTISNINHCKKFAFYTFWSGIILDSYITAYINRVDTQNTWGFLYNKADDTIQTNGTKVYVDNCTASDLCSFQSTNTGTSPIHIVNFAAHTYIRNSNFKCAAQQPLAFGDIHTGESGAIIDIPIVFISYSASISISDTIIEGAGTAGNNMGIHNGNSHYLSVWDLDNVTIKNCNIGHYRWWHINDEHELGTLYRWNNVKFENNNFDIIIPEETTHGNGDLFCLPGSYILTGFLDAAKIDIWYLEPILINSLRRNERHIKVSPIFGEGDYTSIKDAVDSVLNTSTTRRVIIDVEPGVYTEDTIDLTNKPFVSIIGPELSSAVIKPSSTQQHQILMGLRNELSFLSFDGIPINNFLYPADIHGYAAIKCTNSGDYSILHKVQINNWDVGILAESTTTPTYVYLELVDFNGVYSFGIKESSSGSGSTYVGGEGISLTPDYHDTSVVGGIFATGDSSILDIDGGVNLGALPLMDNSYGFKLENGVKATVKGFVISNVDKALKNDDSEGIPIVFDASGLFLRDNNTDVAIAQTTASVGLQGGLDINKIDNASSNLAYVVVDSVSRKIEIFNSRMMNINDAQRLYVDKSSPNAYQKISDAIAAITDSSITKPYIVEVSAGVYPEETMTIPEYVRILGSGINTTIIDNTGQNNHCFIAGGTVEISHMSIWNVEPGYCGFYNEDTTFSVLNKISFFNCDTAVWNRSISADLTDTYLEYCDASGFITTQYKCTSVNGFQSILSLENNYSYTDIGPSATDNTFVVDGFGTDLLFVGSTVWGGGFDTGIYVTNSARLDGQSLIVKNCATGITSDGILLTSDPLNSIQLSGTNFIDNTINLDISAYTNGSFAGYTEHEKNIINTTSDFFITEKDPLIITVAKHGADYKSVKDACDSIMDSSSVKPYLIRVGPGIFIEDEINLTVKPFVCVTGASIIPTIISPTTSTQNQFLLGVGNELSFLTLTGTNGGDNSGYAAIACIDSGDYSQVHKVQFNDWDIGVFASSSDGTTPTIVYLEYVDFNGSFTCGTKAISTGTGITSLSNENYWVLPTDDTVTTIGTYASGNGTIVTIEGGQHTGALPIVTNTNGIFIEDGSEISVTSYVIKNVDVAVYNPNTGNPVVIGCRTGVALLNNNIDIQIDNSATTGGFIGVFDADNISIASPLFGWVALHRDLGSLEISNTINLTQPLGTRTEILELIKNSQLGLISGGQITLSGLTTPLSIDVSDVTGYFLNGIDELQKIIPPNGTTLTLDPDAENYIYVDQTGVITNAVSAPAETESILLGRVYTNSTDILFIDQVASLANNFSASYDDIAAEIFGSLFVRGSIVETGSSALKIKVTDGRYYVGSNQFNPSGSSGGDVTFTYFYRDNPSGWITGTSDTLDDGFYDDGSGTLAALPSNKFVRHALYIVGDGTNEQYFLVYGQEYYNSSSLAQAGTLPTKPSFFTGGVVSIASFIIQESSGVVDTILTERPLPTTQISASASTSDHLALSNLTSGDSGHSQFLMLNGSKTMTANLPMGGFSITGVNLVDGIDVDTHGIRHNPNGSDPSGTALVGDITSLGTVSAGIANNWSRGDHRHSHGDLSAGGGTQHSKAQVGLSAVENTALSTWAGSTNLTTLGTIATGTWTGTSIDITYTDAKVITVTGTASRLIIGGTGTDPTFDISTSYVGQATITTLGTITTGTWTGSSIATTYTDAKIKTATGTASRLTVGGTLTDPIFNISASYAGQATITILGTIATGTWTGSSIATTYTDAKIKTVTGTSNRLSIGGTATDPTFDISTSYAGQATITTLGTITTGTWTGSSIATTNTDAKVKTVTGTAARLTIGGTSTDPTFDIATTYVGQATITTLGTITTGTWTGSSITTAYTDAKVKTITGTASRLTIGGTATDPTFDISTSYVGQATITTLGTITIGAWTGSSISTTYTDAKVKTVTGTANRLSIGGTTTDPTFDISTNYAGQSSITTLGTITTGTWTGSSIATTYTDAKVKTATGTASRLTVGGTATDPTFDISTSYVGQATITTVGTITTGTWTGTDVAVADGGTGSSTAAGALSNLGVRAGHVTDSSFSGNPKKATITFSTTMGTTNYSIGITGDVNRTWTYESKSATGFVINSNANGAFTGEVSWQVIGDV